MRFKMMVLVAMMALAQGCTVVGIVVGTRTANNDNAERQARIDAGRAEPGDEDGEASVAGRAIGGLLLGLAIDGFLIYQADRAIDDVLDGSGTE
jgi:hypothetical protein